MKPLFIPTTNSAVNVTTLITNNNSISNVFDKIVIILIIVSEIFIFILTKFIIFITIDIFI